MLKRVVHISIIFLLLVSTSGITFYRHYCGNSLIFTSIGHEPKKCCGDDCKGCHNESQTYKITDNYEFSKSDHEFKSFVIKLLSYSSHASICLNSGIDFYNSEILTSFINTSGSLPEITQNPFALLQIFRL